MTPVQQIILLSPPITCFRAFRTEGVVIGREKLEKKIDTVRGTDNKKKLKRGNGQEI